MNLNLAKDPEMERKTWWHGSTRMVLDPSLIAAGPGFHVGTKAQAKMRNSAYLHEISIAEGQLGRAKDRQNWTSIANRARSAGKTGVLYLNRYEGMSTKRLEELLKRGLADRLDSMPDREFRLLVPEAEDSLLAVNGRSIRLERIFDRHGEVVWQRAEQVASLER